MIRIFLVLALSLFAAIGTHAEAKKKLIEFGWDEPDTQFLKTHIREMQQTPFDGCVFHVDFQTADGKKGNFTWSGWGPTEFTEQDLHQAFDDLRATSFGRFNCNFLRFNTTPAKIDWFDDHTAVLSNAKLAAKLAKAGGCSGVLFDIEQYDGALFNYRKQRDAKSKSWEVYAAQSRLRGEQVMESFQEGYPGLTVFLTFGYSLPWLESSRGKGNLAECNYGLLAPFLDGMLKAAKGGVRIVDGGENAYGYKAASEFQAARKTAREELLPIVQDPESYARFFSVGFGIWLDHDWRKRGWDEQEPSKNYFSPEGLAKSVRAAFENADDYVWIYSETPRWWSAEGKPVKLPAAYGEALKEIR